MAQGSPFPPTGSVTAAHAASQNPPPVKDSFHRLVDGLQSFFREHLALARLELRDDLTRIIKDVALSAAGLPMLLVGYVFAMITFALLLALVLQTWAAFGIIALVNLGAGATLAVIFGKRIGKQDKLELNRTNDELQRDKQWVASLREGTRPLPIPAALPPQSGKQPQPNGKPVPMQGAAMPPVDGRVPTAGR